MGAFLTSCLFCQLSVYKWLTFWCQTVSAIVFWHLLVLISFSSWLLLAVVADTDTAVLAEVDSYFHERAVHHDWSKGLYHPLHYWKENQHRFPWLSKLAIDVLCVPASTGSVERAFSVATDILSAKRLKMKADLFEALMIIKCNKHLV